MKWFQPADSLGVWIVQFVFFVASITGMWMLLSGAPFISYALAAETLPAVSPPTDWTGVAVLSAVAILAIAITGYILHIKRTPGAQLGEETIEAISLGIANAVHAKLNPPPAPQSALSLDGIVFTSEEDLAKYKAAKATIDAFKTGGTT